ncbi:MAG TPA: tyrosine-type recombinase/integrase [Streptosporangiaceae bacterium]|nr:tyrosine-type recombinase/integrase [Streptosporangiaceae bacterium]
MISLLALNGLRVSEATGANIEALGIERGRRTLVVTRKGGKVVTVPLAPRTARAIDLAIGERSDGPVFLTADGRRLDRHGAGRIVRRVARRAGITKLVGPHTLRHHPGSRGVSQSQAAGRWGQLGLAQSATRWSRRRPVRWLADFADVSCGRSLVQDARELRPPGR